MNKANEAKENDYVWEADSRYFEKKPKHYFRAITVLAFLISLLLFFLREILLIILVWLVFFVAYVRSIIEPVKTKYQINTFGVNYYGGLISFKQIAAFSVLFRKQSSVLRIITQPTGLQYDLVLPKDKRLSEEIVKFLKQKAPFLDELPESGIEKISRFLGKVTGLGA